MKKIIAFLLSALLAFTPALGAEVFELTTGGTAYNLRDEGTTVTQIQLISTTTNATVVKLFDTSNTTTNIVRAEYQNYITYATNFTTVFTNESGILVTNEYSGLFTTPETVQAVTNARPAVFTTVVAGNTARTVNVNLRFLRGVTAVASASGTLLELELRP